MKKIILGAVMSAAMLLAVSGLNWELLFTIKVGIFYVMSLFASYYQADYSPFNFKNQSVDKGTVLHIIWTVYLTQVLAFAEAFYLNPGQLNHIDGPSWIFLVVAVFGLWFRSWAYITLGKFFTMHLETQKEHQLVQNGPYKLLRHPSYTGAFLTYVFNPLFIGAYYSSIVAVIFLAWAFYRRISFEENMLHKQLGAAYEKFCVSRKRLFPGIW